MHVVAVELRNPLPSDWQQWHGAATRDFRDLRGETHRLLLCTHPPSWITAAAACGHNRCIRWLLERQGRYGLTVAVCGITAVDVLYRVRVQISNFTMYHVLQRLRLAGLGVAHTLPLPPWHDKQCDVRRVWTRRRCCAPGCTSPRQIEDECFAHFWTGPASLAAPSSLHSLNR